MQAGKREMWIEQVTMDAITNLPLACALVVDAKGEDAQSFYEHYGFTPCRDNPMTLYLPLGA